MNKKDENWEKLLSRTENWMQKLRQKRNTLGQLELKEVTGLGPSKRSGAESVKKSKKKKEGVKIRKKRANMGISMRKSHNNNNNNTSHSNVLNSVGIKSELDNIIKSARQRGKGLKKGEEKNQKEFDPKFYISRVLRSRKSSKGGKEASILNSKLIRQSINLSKEEMTLNR